MKLEGCRHRLDFRTVFPNLFGLEAQSREEGMVLCKGQARTYVGMQLHLCEQWARAPAPRTSGAASTSTHHSHEWGCERQCPPFTQVGLRVLAPTTRMGQAARAPTGYAARLRISHGPVVGHGPQVWGTLL